MTLLGKHADLTQVRNKNDREEQIGSERLRRVAFFARYEASLAGSAQIEWPHLFLALIREDRSLVTSFLPTNQAVVGLCLRIQEDMPARSRRSLSADIPMAPDCVLLIESADRQTSGQRRRQAPLEALFVSLVKAQPDWFRRYGIDIEVAQSVFLYPALDLPLPAAANLAGIPATMVEFRGVVDEIEAALGPMPEGRAEEPVVNGAAAWSRKQLVGFLIDSASNQHQLLVRALVSQQPEVAFADFDPVAWVTATGYQESSWRVLMDLCVTSHRLLYDIANRVEAERFNRIVCRVGNGPSRSLADILRDYVTNLRRKVSEFPR